MSGQGGRGGVMAVVGGAGAAIVAGATYFFGGDDEVPEVSDVVVEQQRPTERPRPMSVDPVLPSAEGSVLFCHPVILAGDGCAPANLLALEGQRFFRDGAMPSRAVAMIGLEADSEVQDVTDCATFGDLRGRNYGAATSAAMRREAQMARACGLLVLAREAQPVEGAIPADADFLLDMDRAELPGLGEMKFTENSVYIVESEAPLIWSLESETMRGEFLHIATANFDNDPEAEHLIEWRLAAAGGSLRAIGYGLADIDPKAFQPIDPFSE